MRETITISLPKKLKKILDKISAQEGISRSDILRESLREYLFLRRFRMLRAQLITKAQAQGIHTDEDVFKLVS